MPPLQVLDYLRRLLETFDGSYILLQKSNSAYQREVPTSYMVKVNFKPSEVSTIWLFLLRERAAT